MKIFIAVLMFYISSVAGASTYEPPWSNPSTPNFFKTHYYDNFETPLIETYNDTATNLCLLLRKKPSITGYEPHETWYGEKVEGAIADKKQNLDETKNIEKFLKENDKKHQEDWPTIIDHFRTTNTESSYWNYAQPTVCGNKQKNLNDFLNFIEKMDLTSEEKVGYLEDRIDVGEYCNSVSKLYADGYTYNNENNSADKREAEEFIQELQAKIGNSKLKERISDYLTALVESYYQIPSTLSKPRALALLKTNIDFIRDSFTYYAIRKLTSDQYTDYNEMPAPIANVTLPDPVVEYFGVVEDQNSKLKLWQKYISEFPKGRFIRSAKGLLRRHNPDHYFLSFEQFLQDPSNENITYNECNQLAEELDTYKQYDTYEKQNSDIIDSPILFTILFFQEIRLDYSSREVLKKGSSDQTLSQHVRNELFALSEDQKKLIAKIQNNKKWDQFQELRDLLNSVLYTANKDYKSLDKIKINLDQNSPSVYYSILKYKAWALEEQGKYDEAYEHWKEIRKNVVLFDSELFSAKVPLLENRALAKKTNLDWSEFKDQQLILSHFIIRYVDPHLAITKLVEDKDLKFKKMLSIQLMQKFIISRNWTSLVELLAVYPDIKKELPNTVWTAAQKLSVQSEDLTSLMVIARHLLKNEMAQSQLRGPFGTLKASSFNYNIFSASDVFLKVINSFDKNQKSDLEAEALSHLSQCYGRPYERDRFCYLSEPKLSVRKAWYAKLHKKYKGSSWAKKTSYYY